MRDKASLRYLYSLRAGNRLKLQWYTYWFIYPAVLKITGGFLIGEDLVDFVTLLADFTGLHSTYIKAQGCRTHACKVTKGSTVRTGICIVAQGFKAHSSLTGTHRMAPV